MEDITCNNEEAVDFTLKPTTTSGKPAKFDGPVKLTVVSGEGTSSVGEDGLSGSLISPDAPGDTTYLVEADADLGEGVETIQDTWTLHVNGANAKSFGATFGAPRPK